MPELVFSHIVRPPFSCSLDSEFLVSTSIDGSARIWKVDDGSPLINLTRSPVHYDNLMCIFFNITIAENLTVGLIFFFFMFVYRMRRLSAAVFLGMELNLSCSAHL